MPYIHFTEEQKLRANSVDLVEFLRRQGEKLIPSGRDKRLASDHSITVRGNEWYDHAAERGGHAISFVQNFYGLTYPEAVTRLLNGEQGEVYVPAEKKEKGPPKEFALPPANQTLRRVYAYLLQQRHISREVLSTFAQKGLIYESRELSIDQTKVYHNAVFVGFDERGVARHAHKRGLYTQGKSYRGNIEGSDPRCSFHRPSLCIRGPHRSACLSHPVPGRLAAAQLCGSLWYGGTCYAVDAGEKSKSAESHPLPGS